jgi:hypothetical protein
MKTILLKRPESVSEESGLGVVLVLVLVLVLYFLGFSRTRTRTRTRTIYSFLDFQTGSE